jgi:phage gp29-like protein
MSLMDWFKTKLTPTTVKEQQTASPQSALLHREFEGHPSRGLTPARLAQILQEAEQGSMLAQAELFMDMEEKDAHIAAELSKRKMAVKKLDWKLDPPRDATATEKKHTKILENLIRDDLDAGTIRLNMLDGIGHGYSCIELGWGRNAQGLWVPDQVEHRPPTWFVCPQDDRNTLHLRDSSSFYGVPLQPFGWIVHVHKARSGYLARTGLHRVLAWPYLYKNYSVRDMAEFLEIYGLPIRVGKYAPTASAEEKRDLLRTVLSIGHNAAGIIPDTMQLELQQVMASGSADSFKVMIDWCEASQSKAILGGTLTSSTGANGNRSLGDVHNEVRLDIRDDDATQLDQTLSSHLVYPMAMLNGLFADNRCPSWVSDTQEPDDLALFADALPKLAAAGARIPVSYVNLKLKIPEPEEGEEILQMQTNPPSPPLIKGGDQAATGLAALAGTPPLEKGAGGDLSVQADIDPTPVDAQTDLLAAAAGAAIKDMVDTIRGKVDQADSLEALRDELLNGYGDLDSSELTKVMALAFAAADLSGRFDVSEGQ